MAEPLTDQEQEVLTRRILRIHGQGWGIAFGAIFGLGLFAATNVLVIRGGEPLGPHLGLLSLYFPGYSVSFAGSLVGFAYAFVVGYATGRVIAAVYNRLTAGLR